MIRAVTLDSTRRAALVNLGALLTVGAAGGASLAPAFTSAAKADPIGDLIDANIETPAERVLRLIGELQDAVKETHPDWRVATWLPDEKSDSFMMMAMPPPPAPLQFSGPGVYEVRIGGIRPTWWVEEAPRKPGYYRCRHVFKNGPAGQWRHFPVGDVKFIAKVEA